MPLKITLAYTDVPGFPGALPALVNDLDLEVTAPDGTLYRGNQFAAGESIPNAATSDNINNVEGVYISQPIPGDYLVRIRARNVVQDARFDTQAIDQDFALVIFRRFSKNWHRPNPAGPGKLHRSRQHQTEVLDAARAASNTVSVTLKSTTESAGETYVLHATGSYGAFTNIVATIVSNAIVDGKLEIHGGTPSRRLIWMLPAPIVLLRLQQICRRRHLAASQHPLTSALSPSLADQRTCQLGCSLQHEFRLNLAVTNSDSLPAIQCDCPISFPAGPIIYRGSTDLAGNSATNNNSGAFFSFVAIQTPAVLLVDAYEPDPDSPSSATPATRTRSPPPAFSYAFWKVTDRGSPQLADLQPSKRSSGA